MYKKLKTNNNYAKSLFIQWSLFTIDEVGWKKHEMYLSYLYHIILLIANITQLCTLYRAKYIAMVFNLLLDL